MYLWTSASLKARARQLLRGRWVPYLAITLLYLVLTGIASEVLPFLLPNYAALTEELASVYEEILFHGAPSDPEGTMKLLGSLYTGAGFISLIETALTLLLYHVLLIGLHRWYMEARSGTPRPSTLFSGFFRRDQWGNVVWVQFWTWGATALWSLLFVIPGIIYSYKVRLVPYLLAENPYMSRKRAIELSTALTEGDKLRIFLLELSFFGWILLIALAESIAATLLPALSLPVTYIGSLFLTVYANATLAEFYATMREKAFRMGLSDATELAGFAA